MRAAVFRAFVSVASMDVRRPGRPLSDGVVSLRPWTRDDARAIAAACAEKEIARWMHLIPQPYTEADAHAFIAGATAQWSEGTGATFAIVEVTTGAIAGSVGMRVIDREQDVVEVGYWATAAFRGHGLTTRALTLISRWLLEVVGAERVQLRADVENSASLRVAEKAGFVREGVLRSSRV